MQTPQPVRPTATISAEIGNLKKSSKRLLEAYIDSGSRDLFGTSRRVVVAKFSAIALAAVGVALSVYGMIYELIHIEAVEMMPNYTDTMQKSVTHGVILIMSLAMALVLKTKNSGK